MIWPKRYSRKAYLTAPTRRIGGKNGGIATLHPRSASTSAAFASRCLPDKTSCTLCRNFSTSHSIQRWRSQLAKNIVTETEPLPVGDPLWTAPNLVITPHSSAASQLTTDLHWSILSENLARFQRGETLMNLVDKARGW